MKSHWDWQFFHSSHKKLGKLFITELFNVSHNKWIVKWRSQHWKRKFYSRPITNKNVLFYALDYVLSFQIYCWVFCFLSILQTMIQFNEWSKRRHTLHRMILVVPFFAVTILYRVMALSLILVFAGGQFGMIPLIGLLLTQVLTWYKVQILELTNF